MDKSLWQKIASLWVSLRSPEERKNTENTVGSIFSAAINDRHREKSLLEDIMSGLDEEDDDDGY
jgi:hypothetical protein